MKFETAKSGEYIVDYEGEFNGSPMMATPGKDDGNTVCERWQQDRLATRREEFFKKVRELDVAVAGKRIVAVNGKFDGEGMDIFYLALEDGTQLVANGVRPVLPARNPE